MALFPYKTNSAKEKIAVGIAHIFKALFWFSPQGSCVGQSFFVQPSK